MIIRDGRTVGEGWHMRAGEPHAEAMALARAGADARGATAYVTLEPCSHFGRTPPCADALIAAGVAEVVIAMIDPNPRVGGEGIARLRAAGIRTRVGLLEERAQALNVGFISRMSRGLPWVRLKAASTLDGKTALENGVSQWITGTAARRDGHRWRARACAVLTGIGTVREDDPQLNVRDVECSRQPLKILIDPRLEVSPNARILHDGRCLVVTASDDPGRAAPLRDRGIEILCLPNTAGKVDLPGLFRELALRECNEIHVEAGFKLNGSLLRERCADELLLYLAPMLVGDQAQGLFNLSPLNALEQAVRLKIRDVRSVGPDLRIIAGVDYPAIG